MSGFLGRAGGAAGMAGPAAFTAAWVISSLRQNGYPAMQVQISGLAAPDAVPGLRTPSGTSTPMTQMR